MKNYKKHENFLTKFISVNKNLPNKGNVRKQKPFVLFKESFSHFQFINLLLINMETII